AEAQMRQIQPLIDAQIQGAQFGIGQARNLFNQSQPYIKGAGQGMMDLKNFWEPLLKGNQTAMDQYLSSEKRLVNQGFRSASENIAKYAPRGGGRVSTLARMDSDRQGKLTDLVTGTRKEAAGQLTNLNQLLGSLGTSVRSLATGTLGAGLGGGSGAYGLLQGAQNRAYDAQNRPGP